MSGPEWTPEPADPSVEARPLSGDLGAGGPTLPPAPHGRGANPFAGHGRSADPARVDQDDAAAQANRHADGLDDDPEAEPAGPSKLAALIGSVRSLVLGLLKRRAKADQPAVDDDQSRETPEAETTATEPTDAPEPERSPRWSPAGWSWETRVGVAAVLSFLILVGVLANKKGWIGGKRSAVTVALPNALAQVAPKQPADAKGDSEKPADAKKSATSPVPQVASNSVARPAVGVEPHHAPTTAGVIPPVTLKGSPPPVDPLSSPTAGEQAVPTVGTETLTAASAGNPQSPPDLPGSPTDAPPLPAGSLAELPDPAKTEPKSPEREPEIKTVEADPKPPGTEPTNPAPAPEPAQLPPTEPVLAAAPPVTTPTSEPTPTPEPVAQNPPATAPITQPAVTAAPLLPASPKQLESVPSSPADSPGSTRGPEWVVIPSAGRRPGAGPDPATSTAAGAASAGGTSSPSEDPGVDRPSRARVADGPPIQDDPAAGSGSGQQLHAVQADENFWTISKQYYGSGRYYKALHKANAAKVPDITKLYIGTVLRIPPPEALDRTLVAPPSLGAAIDGSTVNRVSSSAKTADSGADADATMTPRQTTRPGLRRARSEPVEAPARRPTYRVKPNDTLRSIARDTLEDSKRAGEIYNLNRDLLDGPKALPTPGTTLTLPDDAVIGRQIR